MSFFRSRWVERPGHVEELEPAALPAGFRAAGVAAGLKEKGLDVGLLVSDEPPQPATTAAPPATAISASAAGRRNLVARVMGSSA